MDPVSDTATALLVIDVQQGLFEKTTPIYQSNRLLENLCTLIERAHRAGAPVIYIQHNNTSFLAPGAAGWQLHPGLSPLPAEPVIQKRHGNAFEDTTLAAELAVRRVGALVVTGLVTHGCVKATVEGALALGYRVTLAADGHSNYHKQAAGVIEEFNRMLEAGGAEVRNTSEIEFH